jgi:hypothetical protein
LREWHGIVYARIVRRTAKCPMGLKNFDSVELLSHSSRMVCYDMYSRGSYRRLLREGSCMPFGMMCWLIDRSMDEHLVDWIGGPLWSIASRAASSTCRRLIVGCHFASAACTYTTGWMMTCGQVQKTGISTQKKTKRRKGNRRRYR